MANGSLLRRIQALAEGLQHEGTTKALCPACSGGSTGEISFSLTLRGGMLLYLCHRASCGLKGAVGGPPNILRSKAPSPSRRYLGDLVPVPEGVWRKHLLPYGISQEDLVAQAITYAEELNRIRFPIYDYRGYVIGENLRAIGKGQGAKVLTNKFNDVPMIHFPLGQEFSQTVVLVEDQISALKVSKVAYCASLLGTYVSDESLSQLAHMEIDEVDVMLDGDKAGRHAAAKAVTRLSPFFVTRVIMVEDGKDPKHLSIEEIRECIYE